MAPSLGSTSTPYYGIPPTNEPNLYDQFNGYTNISDGTTITTTGAASIYYPVNPVNTVTAWNDNAGSFLISQPVKDPEVVELRAQVARLEKMVRKLARRQRRSKLLAKDATLEEIEQVVWLEEKATHSQFARSRGAW